MIRIDMSEYQERHAVSRLIGAPPGYVGYEESGQLTEAVRRKPYAVILLDEIEKAHPDVFNILLQVLDDGRLTDNKGRTVDFRNTIIIMTSNLGSEYIQNLITDNQSGENNHFFLQAKEKVMEMLKSAMRPEFLNRIDEIVMFHPLRKDEIAQVVAMQFEQIKQMLGRNGMMVTISARALEHLALEGYDPHYGARPVKRVLQKRVLNELSKLILAEKIDKNAVVTIDYDGKALVFSNTGHH
ncbi:MAG TPA: AAA family ATPase, partial [Bacteroidales bacterium]|nr:AAA family ATPase [Bacteroidales bacterium]